MDSTQNLLERLEQLHRIGAALSRERDINHLLESILEAAKRLLWADGGTLYRVTEDGEALRFAIVRTDSLGLRLGGVSEEAPQFPDLPLRLPSGALNDSLVAVHAAVHDRTINIADAYCQQHFDFSGTRAFDARTGYRSQSFLTVPMKNHENELIGVLQLINAIDPATGQVCAFTAQDQRLAESLASQAAIALSNRQLITQLETLFESFVQLINLAIDEKSPYTGGLRFSVDMNQPRGNRIGNPEVRDAGGNWKPLDPAASYRLITNNFTAEGGDKYDTLKAIPAAQREDTFLDYADSFLQYVRSRSPLAKPAVAGRSTQSYVETP